MKNYLKAILPAIAFSLLATLAHGASLTVDMAAITTSGRGDSIGSVTIEETEYGLLFTPNLRNLPTGVHGFHIHENPDCSPGPDAKTGKTIAGGAAGPHYDPQGNGTHGSPWRDDGHLGDLPPLYVAADGTATTPVLAPRIKKLDEIRQRSLMIHHGGDNFSDQPEANGGGGERIACGIIR